MIQANTAISHRIYIYSYLLLLVVVVSFLVGCKEVSPYSSNCKDFNEEYLTRLSTKGDIDSARELASLYAECNPDNDKKYTDLALLWSDKVISFKEATENDLTLYRILRNLDVDTGEPEK